MVQISGPKVAQKVATFSNFKQCTKLGARNPPPPSTTLTRMWPLPQRVASKSGPSELCRLYYKQTKSGPKVATFTIFWLLLTFLNSAQS